ncbi:MAG: Thioredoxin reductase (NADPH) [Parcubacteria group bacterium GW2011_GWF2_38_76]|nr:MAG: Thioredoxin reductase (NADPH) [Parcubacteria group bacterium GW2011_GWF2_38_76]HBM45717.1 thioredoxin reductase [Patescibacteria group bacterium]
MEIYDTTIIGFGPAGFTAALYAGRFEMKTMVIGLEFGGYTAKAGIIHNYPGVKKADGYELAKTMKEQAEEAGAKFYDGEVVEIEKKDNNFILKTKDSKTFYSKTVILATGSERRKMGLPREKELENKGIHYCVTCDGPVYVGKDIAVVGGGNAGVSAVLLASEYARKIYLLAAGEALTAEPLNVDRVKGMKEKVEILYKTQVKEFLGKERLTGLLLSREFNGSDELKIDGLFVEIGSLPANKLAKDLGIELNDRGYVKSDTSMKTNISGAFVAGDLCDVFGSFKQNITAAASGALAANSSYYYLRDLNK